jgi:hypothetical protein
MAHPGRFELPTPRFVVCVKHFSWFLITSLIIVYYHDFVCYLMSIEHH